MRFVANLSVSSRNVRGMWERPFRCTPHGVCSLGLHLVRYSNFRRRIPRGHVTGSPGESQGQIADAHGAGVVAKEVMPDHVHLFVRVGPTDAPASVVGRSRAVRAAFPWLRRRANVLWLSSYFVASVSYVLESTVRRYSEHQLDKVA